MADTSVTIKDASNNNIPVDAFTQSGGDYRQAVVIGDAGSSTTAEVSGAALVTRSTRSSISSVISVNDSATEQTLLSSNTGRLAAFFYNDSTSILYLKLGTGATTTSFTVKIPADGFYELPTFPVYTGQINGIWSSDSTGAVRITELT